MRKWSIAQDHTPESGGRELPGETTLSVVTADTKFYSYSISYNAHPAQSYVRIGGEAPTPHTLPVGKEKQLFLIFPAGITYVDYGSTNVEVDKAEGWIISWP